MSKHRPQIGPVSATSVPDSDELAALWTRMVTIREFEAEVSRIAQTNEVDGYLHTYAGQEAVACGIIPLLHDDDWLTSTYRNHGHAIARGVPLAAIAGELFGKATGVCSGKGGSMHVADQHLGMIGSMGIVAGGLPIAAGAAFAARYNGEARVAVAFFGDGAVHQGAWHEALEFASLFDCPVVFVCENNLYAETTAVDYHLLGDSVSDMVAAYRIPALQVDGMDVLAVRAVGHQAIEYARTGNGPVLVEAFTYRYGGQYEGDTQTYKPPAEVAEWRAKDPLTTFRAKMTAGKGLNEEDLARLADQASREVQAAFDDARNAPWPSTELVTADVYTN